MKIFLGAALFPILLLAQAPNLDQLRNLGKAFYENPTTQKEAVETFARALALSDTPRERLNYGLALLHAGQSPEALAELERVQKQAPEIPHTWFTIGIERKKQGESETALAQMLGAARLAPGEAIIHYNIGVLQKQLGRPVEALTAFERARDLDGNLAAARFQLYNSYRQAQRQTDAQRELAVFQALKKQYEGAAVPEDVDWCQYSEIYDPVPPPPAKDLTPLTFSDTALAGAWRGAAAYGEQFLTWDQATLRLGGLVIANIAGIRSLSAGDFNNDGLVDLCVVSPAGLTLLQRKGSAWVRASLPLPEIAKSETQQCVWLDYDHDYDLDLVLIGAKSYLLRNQGPLGFTDQTAAFPFVDAPGVEAVAFRSLADTRGFDLVVSYANQSGVLYKDKLLGQYEAKPLAMLPAGARQLRGADLNADGQLDLAFLVGAKAYRTVNRAGSFSAAEPLEGEWRNLQAADLRLDGYLELYDSAAILGNTAMVQGPKGWVQRRYRPAQNRSVVIRLEGVKNLRTAIASEVEVKIGGHYQKRTYEGFPLRFGLGKASSIDTVRITWPNGLIQNEIRQSTDKGLSYKEAQRLSGSCPIVWTWNGREFEYITDVLGVAPLGASAGDGTFFPTDEDEYIAIRSESLEPKADGTLEIRLTEELSEAAYFDRVKLLAVDHPVESEIFSNEKWKAPPFPEFRLYGVSQRVYPRLARDQEGNDVTELLSKKDRRYPNSFRRTATGIAEPHALSLDFGAVAAANQAILVLDGWVDWADGSSFLSAAQDGVPLEGPKLQVRNAKGEWQTVIADMGMPSGKPKTITVDLSGKFLSASREIRILTNLCVYWDEIFLGESSAPPQVQVNGLLPLHASLAFRGFSPSIIHPERKQPEHFLYPNPSPTSLWNPTPGNYTRYGDVRALVSQKDDQLSVMGSGDELRLEFDWRALPPLRPGWRRDYLLQVDGWAKDRDANTAHGQSVEPLPFQTMGTYPSTGVSPASETQRQFNTRPALRLLRPLSRSQEDQ